MSSTPVFDSLLGQYPGIHRASHIFPAPPPEPYISFIKERGRRIPQQFTPVTPAMVAQFQPSQAPEMWP